MSCVNGAREAGGNSRARPVTERVVGNHDNGTFKWSGIRFWIVSSASNPEWRTPVVCEIPGRLPCDCPARVLCSHKGAEYTRLGEERAATQIAQLARLALKSTETATRLARVNVELDTAEEEEEARWYRDWLASEYPAPGYW